ncbi:hypothetical protein AB2G23_24190 (plasmid) [Escherichia coli]
MPLRAQRLPWIPDDVEWLRFLEVAGQADELVLVLCWHWAYDCGITQRRTLHSSYRRY